MAFKYVSDMFSRTAHQMSQSTGQILRMSGTDPLQTQARSLYAFRTRADVSLFATGCDGDVGGRSTVSLALQDDPEDAGVRSNQGRPYLRFFGEMRTDVQDNMKGKLRGGYSGMRNKHRPTLFGEVTDDLSLHEYLALRVRAGGDSQTNDSYYVNIQTDGPITTDLWQHRLYLRRSDGGWEDIFIPFSSFRLTNSGELVEAAVRMGRERVRSIGISLLGGKSGVQGFYELGLDSISVTNEQDLSGLGLKEPEKENVEAPKLSDLLPNPPTPAPLPGTAAGLKA